jgi:hypothetical protein
MIRFLKKPGIEGTYVNIVSDMYDKPVANIILNKEEQIISSYIRNKTRMSTLPTLIQLSV